MKKTISVTFLLLLFGFLFTVAERNELSVEDENGIVSETVDKPLQAIIEVNEVTGKSKEAVSQEINETEDGHVVRSFKTFSVTGESKELTEGDIYSFFQGSQAWYAGRTWGGEWGAKDIQGNAFSDFGCGLCCLANIYNTLSPYEVSPWDMFEYAQIVSGYSPNGSSAAIGWSDLQRTLTLCGVDAELHHKPMTYNEFQQQIKNSQSALVLVSSVNDNTFWETTKGHYVVIWLYDEETDTIFLTDSGRFTRNRKRIPLVYVYNALKTASNYQYLMIEGYDEENNTWKADGITDVWYRP